MPRPNHTFEHNLAPISPDYDCFESTMDMIRCNDSFVDWLIEQGDLNAAERDLQWNEKVLFPIRDATLAAHPEWGVRYETEQAELDA